MTKQPLLEAKNIKKYFPIYSGLFRRETGSIKAVDDNSLNIYPGEVLGIVGESGCGKSTLGRCLTRLIEPTAGTLLFNGDNFLKLKPAELRKKRREIQIIFQDPYASLNPRKTIAYSLTEGLLTHNLAKTPQDALDLAVDVLETVGLNADILYRYPHEFSGGQQQRICIARAISLKPKLLICDEAVSALDVSVQAQILNLLSDLKESLNISYLFISHDLSVVRHLCDRVIVLYLGQVMEAASCEALFKHPKHPYTQALLSAIPKDHPKQKNKRHLLKGDLPSSLYPPKGCPFHTRCPLAEARCSTEIIEKKSCDLQHDFYCIHDL